jgi:hypothetical protein
MYYNTINNSNTTNYEIVYYKTIRFGTQIWQKYTKHYYLIKLKDTIRLWYTNIHTKIYKFLIKFSFYSYNKISY